MPSLCVATPFALVESIVVASFVCIHVLGVESLGLILVNGWNLKCEILPHIFGIVSNCVELT